MLTTWSASEREMSRRWRSTPHWSLRVLGHVIWTYWALAPIVFQALVNDVLRDMANQVAFVYLNDILLIFSKDINSHKMHVRSVLLRLLQNNLFVKAEKGVSSCPHLFLGFVISPNQITMDSNKVAAVLDWPSPKDRKQLQRFLGFANFYRKFIKNYSFKFLLPFTHSLQLNQKYYGTNKLKTYLSLLRDCFLLLPSCTLLILRSSSLLRWMHLAQTLGRFSTSVVPMEECIHVLSIPGVSAERNNDVNEREPLAVKLALEEWKHWLEGSKELFKVWTDHNNLEYLKTAKRLKPRQARWALSFWSFILILSYRPGAKSTKSDALSWISESNKDHEERGRIHITWYCTPVHHSARGWDQAG